MVKLTKKERQRLAWKRHREVGEPEGYDGPCWGPTEADYAWVDAQTPAPPAPTTREDQQ
jgi:hypothetical protein